MPLLLPVVTNNVTLNVFNKIFKDVAYRHAQLNSYRMGYPDSMQANQVSWYPQFAVVPPDAQFNFGTGVQFNSITYSFNFIIADLVQKDLSNLIEVLSDSYQVLWDVIQMIRTDYDYEYDISTYVLANDFTSRWTDDVTGVEATISITVPRSFGACDAPIKPEGDQNYVDPGWVDMGYFAYYA